MIDESAIKAIQAAEATTATNASLNQSIVDGMDYVQGIKPMVAVHKDFSLQDLESSLPHRSRFRGNMSTDVIEDFIEYSKRFADESSACFVSRKEMSAETIFDIGEPAAPGHGEHTARITLKSGVEFNALKQADGDSKGQKSFAEWLEDWRGFIIFNGDEGEVITASAAISAIRRMTIEANRKQDSEVGDFSAKKSTLESIEAKSENLPKGLTFNCEPYEGLGPHQIDCRISVLTSGDSPKFVLRIRSLERHMDELSKIFVGILSDKLGESITITRGTMRLS